MPFSAQNLNENQQKIAALISAKADELGVDRDFALALAHAESSLNQFDEKNKVLLGPPPKNKKGERAIGVMQVKPSTAKDYGFSSADLLDPEKNITAGVTYLKNLIDQSEGDKAVAAAKYNWGPGRDFFKTGEGELPEETVKYLRSIKGFGGFGDAANPERATPEQTPPPEEPVEVPPAAEIPVAQPTAETPKSPEEIQKEETEGRKADTLTAGLLGGAAGAGLGYAGSKINAVENRAMREETGRLRAQQQMERLRAASAPVPPAEPGNLPGPRGGTSGEKWARNWGGFEAPGSRSVPESSSIYNRRKFRGSPTMENIQRIAPVLDESDKGKSMWQRLSDQSDRRAAAVAEEQRIAQEAERARLAAIAQQEAEAARPINRARAALSYVSETPIGRVGSRIGQTMSRYMPVVGYGLAGASLASTAEQMRQDIERQRYIDAVLDAAQMATTGASMIPPLAPVAVPLDLGLGAYRALTRD